MQTVHDTYIHTGFAEVSLRALISALPPCCAFFSYPIFFPFSLQENLGLMSQQRQTEGEEGKQEGGDTQHWSPDTVAALCCQGIICETSPQIAQLLCAWVYKTTTDLHMDFNFEKKIWNKQTPLLSIWPDLGVALNCVLPFFLH